MNLSPVFSPNPWEIPARPSDAKVTERGFLPTEVRSESKRTLSVAATGARSNAFKAGGPTAKEIEKKTWCFPRLLLLDPAWIPIA